MSTVLARKYRPKNFETLIGQEPISQTLSLALDQNRLSHAYLFSGLRGSGKTSTARIFAKALLCDCGPTSKPCEICENCKAANEGRHIDIVEMDAASSRKIDDIRDLIEHTKYKPSIARFKIFIIDEVHMLTKEAFNALLKTLEEPPAFIKFILATTDPLKLPATILSRTQHFRFKKISKEDVIHHLSHILNLENIEYEKEALDILARSGGGSLRDTLTLLDQGIVFSKGFIDTQSVVDMVGAVDPKFIDDIFEAILKREKDRVFDFVKKLALYEAQTVIDELILSLKDKFFEEDYRFDPILSERFFRILSQAKGLLQINADGEFTLALCFMKMLEATKIKEIDEIINNIQINLEQDILKNPAQTPTLKPMFLQASANENENKDDKRGGIQNQPQEFRGVDNLGDIDFSGIENFKKLILKLYDRNAQIGEVFEKNVEFVSFVEGKINLNSYAQDNDRIVIRNNYPIIKQFIYQIFGEETQISVNPKEREKIEKEEKIEKKEGEEKKEIEREKDGEKNQEVHSQLPKHQEPEANDQSSSMMEDIEGDNFSPSCIENICTQNIPEHNPQTILEDPLVQKAIDMFDVKKVIVKQRI